MFRRYVWNICAHDRDFLSVFFPPQHLFSLVFFVCFGQVYDRSFFSVCDEKLLLCISGSWKIVMRLMLLNLMCFGFQFIMSVVFCRKTFKIHLILFAAPAMRRQKKIYTIIKNEVDITFSYDAKYCFLPRVIGKKST